MQPIEDAEEIAVSTPPPDQLLETGDEIGRLRRALDSLSDDDREVILMSRYQGMKYQEIGRVMGVTEGAVKVRMFRALKHLAERVNSLQKENIHEL